MSVFLEAPTLQFSMCTLHFTPQNFNELQTIKLMPSPYIPSPLLSTTRPSEMITALISVPYSTAGPAQAPDTPLVFMSTQRVMVNYKMQSSTKCSSTNYTWNNQKFVKTTIFDGQAQINTPINYQIDYFLVQFPLLDILKRESLDSSNKLLFIRFRNTFLEFSVQDAQPTLQLTTLATSTEDGVKIETTTDNSFHRYDISLPDVGFIRVSSNKTIEIYLSNHFRNKGLLGVCGNFDGVWKFPYIGDWINPNTHQAKGDENYFLNGVNAKRAEYNQTEEPQGLGTCQHPASIVNQPFVAVGQHRYVSRLIACDKEDSSKCRPTCGGTLIAPNAILTAATCVNNEAPLKWALVGGHYLDPNNFSVADGIQVDVVKVIRHPRYNETSLTHNAALLLLSQNITTIEPVHVSFEQVGPNTTTTWARGWGAASVYLARSLGG
jgi:hypothetical protein